MVELDKLYKETREKMHKTLEFIREEFSTIRTARASPEIFSHLFIEYYGSKVPINQVATISCKDARLILIQPWDKTVLPEIKKAILASDLGLNPQVEADVIRVVIPPLTQERRQELERLIKRKAEEAKIAIRNIRRDINHKIKQLEKGSGLSEDQMHKAIEKVQKITDEYISKIEELLKLKEKEILEG
jgi:ribosome recycling factor